MDIRNQLIMLTSGLPLDPLPGPKSRDPSLPHAPVISVSLTVSEESLAVKNALRYFPSKFHETLREEFLEELRCFGHIYMYRFIPDWIEMKAYPISCYPCKCITGAAIMAMIMNNLDHKVAQFPHELVTYGGNGQVFSNWAQFWITLKYLAGIQNDQTLSLYSGHPLGVFPSMTSSPRVVITNGMMVPRYCFRERVDQGKDKLVSDSSHSVLESDYNRLFALGVTSYGQMTAGSFCYIGPQGIVHGTVLTLLNAKRKYLNNEDNSIPVFLTSGLGGMSGAQAKAAVITNCIGIIAEVDKKVIDKRKNQGWVDRVSDDAAEIIQWVLEFKQEYEAKKRKNETVTGISIAFHGNIICLWRHFYHYFQETKVNLVNLASDQTSCHNVFGGGYWPEEVSFSEAQNLLKVDGSRFKELVKSSLRTHVSLIEKLSASGTKFWDYGNAFLLEASRAGAEGLKREDTDTCSFNHFVYPSYVQDIMGDIFSLGFGPFRWVCMSQSLQDLQTTDSIAMSVMQLILDNNPFLPNNVVDQYRDNMTWIEACQTNNLVVGSTARILYSDQLGRVLIAQAFNQGIREGKITGPIVVSRDHHDVSGTDSPFRETSNITDASSVTADMATSNFAGTGIRGADWIALHNGGGVGWGEAVNGGFGLVLTGDKEDDHRIKTLLSFDVCNGVARRSWGRNKNARQTILRAMNNDPKLIVTLPYDEDDDDNE